MTNRFVISKGFFYRMTCIGETNTRVVVNWHLPVFTPLKKTTLICHLFLENLYNKYNLVIDVCIDRTYKITFYQNSCTTLYNENTE